ncbi:hypothetical protein BDZ91DRAFT_800103 [Kalaharituber pfeilii]|nr:hypothetical protein BDZ91DRAFT_800103 [Kalaharituber pfeilii]
MVTWQCWEDLEEKGWKQEGVEGKLVEAGSLYAGLRDSLKKKKKYGDNLLEQVDASDAENKPQFIPAEKGAERRQEWWAALGEGGAHEKLKRWKKSVEREVRVGGRSKRWWNEEIEEMRKEVNRLARGVRVKARLTEGERVRG